MISIEGKIRVTAASVAIWRAPLQAPEKMSEGPKHNVESLDFDFGPETKSKSEGRKERRRSSLSPTKRRSKRPQIDRAVDEDGMVYCNKHKL